MSAEENKALARRSWAIVDNPDIIDEVYAPDVVWHEPDQDIQGTEEAKQFITMYKTAFPDMKATVEDVIAEGDKVSSLSSGRRTDPIIVIVAQDRSDSKSKPKLKVISWGGS